MQNMKLQGGTRECCFSMRENTLRMEAKERSLAGKMEISSFNPCAVLVFLRIRQIVSVNLCCSLLQRGFTITIHWELCAKCEAEGFHRITFNQLAILTVKNH
ncbi:hypothetical protein FEM48_Zijuj04G0075200 [Ziziphus jujuba var. spinosa]|uniref:Uncharacterized protein n=1 Tax=Ziziphus jujuba var. spinosa TaxID=714518 RepID=A0A978VIL3_ZIZJJ|nr:hypothetical protein FEM48_Zijuj04G0075200 [Ziziphus jujuba var. spinosa]